MHCEKEGFFLAAILLQSGPIVSCFIFVVGDFRIRLVLSHFYSECLSSNHQFFQKNFSRGFSDGLAELARYTVLIT